MSKIRNLTILSDSYEQFEYPHSFSEVMIAAQSYAGGVTEPVKVELYDKPPDCKEVKDENLIAQVLTFKQSVLYKLPEKYKYVDGHHIVVKASPYPLSGNIKTFVSLTFYN